MYVINLATVIFFFLALFSNCLKAQSKIELVSEQKLENVRIESDSIHDFLSNIAIKFKIPIGFENIASENLSCKLKSKIIINSSQITVKQLMQTLMVSSTNCDWKEFDSVINVYSKYSAREFLETVIHDFEIIKGLSNLSIKESLIELPEVKLALKKESFRLTTFTKSQSELKPISDDFSECFSVVSLRHILNQIAKNSKSKYWNISNWGNDKKIIFLSF